MVSGSNANGKTKHVIEQNSAQGCRSDTVIKAVFSVSTTKNQIDRDSRTVQMDICPLVRVSFRLCLEVAVNLKPWRGAILDHMIFRATNSSISESCNTLFPEPAASNYRKRPPCGLHFASLRDGAGTKRFTGHRSDGRQLETSLEQVPTTISSAVSPGTQWLLSSMPETMQGWVQAFLLPESGRRSRSCCPLAPLQ